MLMLFGPDNNYDLGSLQASWVFEEQGTATLYLHYMTVATSFLVTAGQQAVYWDPLLARLIDMKFAQNSGAQHTLYKGGIIFNFVTNSLQREQFTSISYMEKKDGTMDVAPPCYATFLASFKFYLYRNPSKTINENLLKKTFSRQSLINPITGIYGETVSSTNAMVTNGYPGDPLTQWWSPDESINVSYSPQGILLSRFTTTLANDTTVFSARSGNFRSSVIIPSDANFTYLNTLYTGGYRALFSQFGDCFRLLDSSQNVIAGPYYVSRVDQYSVMYRKITGGPDVQTTEFPDGINAQYLEIGTVAGSPVPPTPPFTRRFINKAYYMSSLNNLNYVDMGFGPESGPYTYPDDSSYIGKKFRIFDNDGVYGPYTLVSPTVNNYCTVGASAGGEFYGKASGVPRVVIIEFEQ